MKSFISSFRYFIPAIIVAISTAIYLGIKQPAEPPTTATVPTSPSLASTPLLPPPPPIRKDNLTPPPPTPNYSTNILKSLPVTPPKQIVTGTDNIYDLASPSRPIQTPASPIEQKTSPFHQIGRAHV